MAYKYEPSFLLFPAESLEVFAEGLKLLDVIQQRLLAGAEVLHETAETVESGGLVPEGRNLVSFGVSEAVVAQFLQLGLAAGELEKGRGYFRQAFLESVVQFLELVYLSLLFTLTHAK